MARVHLVHWNESEAALLIDKLSGLGHQVTYRAHADSSTLRELRAGPPDAAVIDLSRLPSHGREFAIALRASKATRQVPIVFHAGDPAKVEAIRALLPDASYTTSKDLARDLKRAISNAPSAPVVPAKMMERYAGRTTAQKLGIREGSLITVLDAPRDYMKVLAGLPPGVTVAESETPGASVTLWFVHDADEYLAALPRMHHLAASSKLWALWRKQKGRPASKLNENLIRETALDFGLVDYKVCSVDETWSGLLFAAAK